MLGSKNILKEYQNGNITISPFNMHHINPNSYDVTLGEYFVKTSDNHSIIDITLPNEQINIWQEPVKQQIIILEPGMFFLAHTEEIIGSKKYATLLKSRSTFARIGLDICASAGFGDVGYINKWTLEIKNNSPHYIQLFPGMRVAQIAFMKVEGKGNLYQGAYQGNDSWTPESMLPVLGRDRVL